MEVNSSQHDGKSRSVDYDEDDLLNKLPFYSQAGKDSVKLYKGLREAKKIERKKRMILNRSENAANRGDLPRYMDSIGIKDTKDFVRAAMLKNETQTKKVPVLLKLLTEPDQKMGLIGCMKQRAIKILQEKHPNIEIPSLDLNAGKKGVARYPDEASGGFASRSPRFEQEEVASKPASKSGWKGHSPPPVGHYHPKFSYVDKPSVSPV